MCQRMWGIMCSMSDHSLLRDKQDNRTLLYALLLLRRSRPGLRVQGRLEICADVTLLNESPGPREWRATHHTHIAQ